MIWPSVVIFVAKGYLSVAQPAPHSQAFWPHDGVEPQTGQDKPKTAPSARHRYPPWPTRWFYTSVRVDDLPSWRSVHRDSYSEPCSLSALPRIERQATKLLPTKKSNYT